MSTLHIFRTEPDEVIHELIRAITLGEISKIALYEEEVDYDRLLDTLFSHDQAISWW